MTLDKARGVARNLRSSSSRHRVSFYSCSRQSLRFLTSTVLQVWFYQLEQYVLL